MKAVDFLIMASVALGAGIGFAIGNKARVCCDPAHTAQEDKPSKIVGGTDDIVTESGRLTPSSGYTADILDFAYVPPVYDGPMGVHFHGVPGRTWRITTRTPLCIQMDGGEWFHFGGVVAGGCESEENDGR